MAILSLSLDHGLLCRLGVDLHGADPAPAAGGLDHPLAQPAGERLPQYPVAARPCSRAADTAHAHIVPSRLKRTRARTRCDGTRLPVAGLGDTDDVVTPTLGPHPANGERLDLWGSRRRFGSFDRRRHRHWCRLRCDRRPSGTCRHDQSEDEVDEPSPLHL
jgi:hypothetical protein